MRKILSRLAIVLVGVMVSPAILLAANPTASGASSGTPGKIHHFTISSVPTAKVGEAIDVTVEAKDKDDKIITNYKGSIFFSSETDFAATLPAQGRSIQFTESDQGVKKISKGVIFKRIGKQELTVSEALEDVGGAITIMVEDGSATSSSGSATESVTITFPEKGTTVTTDTITMSGKSRKNSRVTVKLNGKELGNTQSDDTGAFTYKLTGVNQQTNALSVSVYDGSNTLLGSSETSFNYASGGPKYYNASVQPGLEIEGGTGITLMIDAEPTLPTVSISIDGATLTAKEGSPGKYSVTTVAPSKAGTYPVNVTLKNILGLTTEKTGAVTLSVKEKVMAANTGATMAKPTFKTVLVSMEGTKVNINFSVDNLPSDVTKFKIAYGDSVNSLTSEVTTYELDKIRQPNGTYNWYIPNLAPKTYMFKIFGMRADGTLATDLASEPQTLIVGKQGSCSIGNIPAVTATTYADKTVLSWPALSGAISYNVYRVTATRDYELVKNVTENSYTLDLAPGSVTYGDFAVKALCNSSTESATPTVASRVQTGPGALALIVVLAALGSVLLMRRKMV